MAAKDIVIKIVPSEIAYTNISKSKNYKYASISVKRADDEYMNVSYEWSGDKIPDFVLDMMSFMQANKTEVASAIETNVPSDEYVEYMESKKGFMPPWLNKKKDKDAPADEEDDVEDDEKMSPEDKKKMKDKMKKKTDDKKKK
jgi:hypothetical protein